MKPVVSNRLMQFSLLALLLAACGRESTPFTLENVEQSSSHGCTSYYLDDWNGDGYDELYQSDKHKERICFSCSFRKTREFQLDDMVGVAGLADLTGDGEKALGILRQIPGERTWISFFDLAAATYPPNPEPVAEIEGFRDHGHDFRPRYDWTCSASLCGMADFDGDGCDDLVVKVQTSYELIPRGIWIYDGKSLRLGGPARILCFFRMAGNVETVLIGDMDGRRGHRPEIVVRSGAPDNWTTHEKPADWPVKHADDRARVLFLEYDSEKNALAEKQCWESKEALEPIELLPGPEMPAGGRYFYLFWPSRQSGGGGLGKVERIDGRTRNVDRAFWFEKRVDYSLSRFEPSAAFKGLVFSCLDGQVELLDQDLERVGSGYPCMSRSLCTRFIADIDCNGTDELVATAGNDLKILSLPGLKVLASRTFPEKPQSVIPRHNGGTLCELCVVCPPENPPGIAEQEKEGYADLLAFRMVSSAPLGSQGWIWLTRLLFLGGGGAAGFLVACVLRRGKGRLSGDAAGSRSRQQFLDVLRSVSHGKITSSNLSQMRMLLGHLQHDPEAGSDFDERVNEIVAAFRGVSWQQLNRVPAAARAAGVSPSVLNFYEAALRVLQEALIESDPAKPAALSGRSGAIVKAIDDLSAGRRSMLDEQMVHFRCDPLQVVARLLKAALPRAREAGVEIAPLQASIGPGVTAFALERDLHFVVDDLLAIAFLAVEESPEKRIELRVDSTGERIVIDVSDTGPGIGEDLRNRIFERDYSTDETGSGPGLFQAAELLDRYGGRIFVARTGPGIGTTLRVELEPVRQA